MLGRKPGAPSGSASCRWILAALSCLLPHSPHTPPSLPSCISLILSSRSSRSQLHAPNLAPSGLSHVSHADTAHFYTYSSIVSHVPNSLIFHTILSLTLLTLTCLLYTPRSLVSLASYSLFQHHSIASSLSHLLCRFRLRRPCFIPSCFFSHLS